MSNLSTNVLSAGRSAPPESHGSKTLTVDNIAELIKIQLEDYEAKFLKLYAQQQSQVNELILIILTKKSDSEKDTGDSAITSTDSDINLITSIESSSVLAGKDITENTSVPPKIETFPSLRTSQTTALDGFDFFERTQRVIRKSQKHIHEYWKKLPPLNETSAELWSRAIQDLNNEMDYRALSKANFKVDWNTFQSKTGLRGDKLEYFYECWKDALIGRYRNNTLRILAVNRDHIITLEDLLEYTSQNADYDKTNSILEEVQRRRRINPMCQDYISEFRGTNIHDYDRIIQFLNGHPADLYCAISHFCNQKHEGNRTIAAATVNFYYQDFMTKDNFQYPSVNAFEKKMKSTLGYSCKFYSDSSKLRTNSKHRRGKSNSNHYSQ